MVTQGHEAELLAVSDLAKSFRGLRALEDVSVSIYPGEIHGVIGPNGAGKTTLFNCLTGYLPPTRGKIVFQGQDITGLRMPAVTRLGIARTFQNIRLFGALTVLDNVRVAQQLRTKFGAFELLLGLPSFRRKEQALTDQAMAHLELFGLADHADRQASSLAYGMQRRLEMARALATSPRLLLLDEPAAGMNVSETDALHQMIVQIKERFGLTIILVEHDMRLVMNMCNRITVLNYGRVLATDQPDAIRRNPQVVESYLGKTHQTANA
ncbi:MAG: ABC transporter ATP-binding protein [Anaerolineae bacterium]|nr:ABC transporter ATP-binding protein [Anaerolineae bacterium]